MSGELPADLEAFLRDGRQLKYNTQKSEIGPITLKDANSLRPSLLTVSSSCQSITSDPYGRLHGVYRVEVYDLVSQSGRYDAEGLFCWIPALQMFGSVDSEHGDIIAFPGIRWTDIVRDPLPFLEAQWDDHEAATHILPWSFFPFHVAEQNVTFNRYPDACPIHDSPICEIEAQHAYRNLRFYFYRSQREENWIEECQSAFPYAGSPVSDSALRCCVTCRKVENDWLQAANEEIVKIPVTPDEEGYIHCPGCFCGLDITDSTRFLNGVHSACGQRILIAK